MEVQRGKLYRMTGHKGLSIGWLQEYGTVWLATEDEWDAGSYRKPDWVAQFKSVANGKVFQLTRHQPWSVELEELDGGNS